ncbi:HAMP domain-containing histidine kinase [Nocardioides mesophilus]|uniref:histidine kinase n=1 Tax=Nocardioides mesophilus TaxID=433659 RepID=A0A7G9RHV2_9ACTN|nr:HAMP domain-containing histidine kinase [Nocardioides mesophilus]
MLVGVLGVAVALAIGSLTLYGVLTLLSYRTLDESARATAADVAVLVDRGRLPDPIPVTGSQVVQVVDGRNRVVSASVNADRLTALLRPEELADALSGEHPEVPGSRVGLGAPLRVTARSAGPPDQLATVVVAQQVGDLEESQRILGLTLLATYPLLLLVLTLIAWRVIGAALGPVEALRSSAERISGAGQDAQLPVPPSDDEIHALAVTLNSMLERLSAARARQRSFVADAAHELRSPLTSMRTQLEIAERLGERTPVTEDLQAEVSRMSTLVEDLLVLARLDADTLPRGPAEPVALRPLLDDLARQPGARVPVSTDGVADVAVAGRPDDLRRVFTNLLDNAVRHAGTGVELAARCDGSAVHVTVSDDGAGIPAAERERVFGRFTRLDDARDRDAGGSGLGLAIVRELVRRSGGEVVLEDRPRGGLTARVVLPAALSEQP